MGILENAKNVAKTVHEINNLELYQRVLNLHSDIIELVEQNNRLRSENTTLKDQLAITGQLEFDTTHHGYYRVKDGKKDGPFCAVCWDVDRKLVNMHYNHVAANNVAYAERTGNMSMAGCSPYSCKYCHLKGK